MEQKNFSQIEAAHDLIDLLFDEECLCLLLSSKHFHAFLKQFELPATLEMIALSGDERIAEFHKFVFKKFEGLNIPEIRLPNHQIQELATQKFQKLGLSLPLPGASFNPEFQQLVDSLRKRYPKTDYFSQMFASI
jgi:hypothetical protein